MSEDVNIDPSKLYDETGPGPNSAADNKNRQAGNELGAEGEKESVSSELSKEPPPPLFLADSPEGKKGNAQDEKDESEE